MSCFRGVIRQITHVTTNGLELPAKRLNQLGVTIQQEQLVYEPGDHIAAQRKARGRVPVLLTLDPGALEKWLVGENARRQANIAEQSLRREQIVSFGSRTKLGVQLVSPA